MTPIDRDEHRKQHIELHRKLDELVADWIRETGSLPSESTVMDLMTWSYQQSLNPTVPQF